MTNTHVEWIEETGDLEPKYKKLIQSVFSRLLDI